MSATSAAARATVFAGENLTRVFGAGTRSVTAVREVSCRVAVADRIALVGTSGSGKSTLLHLIAGLDRPSGGRASWPAIGDPRRPPGRIGVVFQTPSLLAPLTVLENVTLPLLLAGESPTAATERAGAALQDLGLHALGERLPEEISGGQAQRVAVARVLATRPVLILADEPTGQLDTATATTVVDVLLTAADRLGAALVVATHDPAVSQRLDQRWSMRDGALTHDSIGAVTPC
jgi:putative ABC transport system ATP-binding protein